MGTLYRRVFVHDNVRKLLVLLVVHRDTSRVSRWSIEIRYSLKNETSY
jgi:hypothetical protein